MEENAHREKVFNGRLFSLEEMTHQSRDSEVSSDHLPIRPCEILMILHPRSSKD